MSLLLLFQGSGSGPTIIEADGSFSGVATAQAVGAAVFASVGSSSGAATAAAVGAAVFAGVGAAPGVATALAEAAAINTAVGLAEGSSEALAVGEDAQAPTSPVVTVDAPGGGGGIAYRPSSLRQKRSDELVSKWVDEEAAEIYSRLVAAEAPAPTRREAGEIAQPFAKTSVAVPASSAVDWAKFSQDIDRVRALLALWQREVETRALIEDDEDAFMVGLL